MSGTARTLQLVRKQRIAPALAIIRLMLSRAAVGEPILNDRQELHALGQRGSRASADSASTSDCYLLRCASFFRSAQPLTNTKRAAQPDATSRAAHRIALRFVQHICLSNLVAIAQRTRNSESANVESSGGLPLSA